MVKLIRFITDRALPQEAGNGGHEIMKIKLFLDIIEQITLFLITHFDYCLIMNQFFLVSY